MRVLLVEDSRTVGAHIEGMLRTVPGLVLLPTATNGAMALEAVIREQPDVVLLDLELPVMDGLEVLRQIMDRAPRPVIVLSAHVGGPTEKAFAALHAGAVEVLAKPEGLRAGVSEDFATRLIGAVRVMSRARVVRRKQRRENHATKPVRAAPPSLAPRYECVLIGASTGGPSVLHEIFSSIQKPYPLPIVVAQHVLEGFDSGLAAWLSTTGHRVALALTGEPLKSGRVYLAPSTQNLLLSHEGLWRVPAEARAGQALPSIDALFDSAARTLGAKLIAVLLTGMGADGAAGLLTLRRAGATTIAQQAATCVVNGMPEVARQRGAVEQSLSPSQIIDLLSRIAHATTQALRLRGLGTA